MKYYVVRTKETYTYIKANTKKEIREEYKANGHKGIEIEQIADWDGKLREENGQVENWAR